MTLNIEQRVENFKKYYALKNERPLLGYFLESEFPLYRYPASKNLPENRPLMPEDFVVEEYLADCDRLFDIHEKAGGDFIWSASSFWGIPWIEAAIGCEIFADHSTGSIHAETPKDFDGTVPEFNRNNPWVEKSVEFLCKITKHSNGRYPLATPRLRGISDLLSCLYGNENFVFKLLEHQKETDELSEKLTDFWIKFAKLQLKNIPLFHNGVGSFYYNMWAPKGTVWLQEDSASLLNPCLFEKHILPFVKKQIAAFDGCIMHMHPTGFFPYKQFIKTDMLALELHIDEGGPSAEQLYEAHKTILSKKPLLIWGYLCEKDIEWILAELPPQGLAINVAIPLRVVNSRDENYN